MFTPGSHHQSVCTGSGGHTATVCLPQGLTTSQCALGQEDTLQLYVYPRVSPLVSVHWVMRTHCNCMFTSGSHTSQCALGQEDTLLLYVYPRVSPLVSVHWVRRTHCNCMFTPGSHHQSVCTGSGGHTATVCLPQGLTTSQCALGQEDTLQLYVYPRVSPLVSVHWVRRTHCNCMFTPGSHHQSVCTGSGGHTATVCLPQGLTTSQCALGQEDTLQLYVYPRVSHQSVCTGSGGHTATVCLPQGLTTSQCALGQEDTLQLYVYPRVSHQSVCTGSGGHTATVCLPQGLTTSQCALGQEDTLQLYVYPRVSPLVSVHWVRRTHCNCMFTPGSHHQSVCTGSGGHTATGCLPQGLTTSQCALGQEDILQLDVYLRVSPLVSVHWVRRTHCNWMFTSGSHHQSVCTGSGGHTATGCLPQGLTTSQCALGQEDILQLYVYPRVSPLVSVHWVRRTYCNCMFTPGSHHQSVCTGSGGHIATVCLPQGLTTSQCALGQEDTLQLYVYPRVSPLVSVHWVRRTHCNCMFTSGSHTSQCALGQEDTLQLYVYPRVSPLVSVHWVRRTYCNCMFTTGSHHQSVCTGSGGHIATVCLPQGLTTSQCALGQEDTLQLYVYPRVSPLVSVHWVRRTHCNCMFTPGSHHQSVCTGSGGHTATACLPQGLTLVSVHWVRRTHCYCMFTPGSHHQSVCTGSGGHTATVCLPQGLTTSQCALGQEDTLQLYVYLRVSPLVSVHWVRRTHCNWMFTSGSHHQSVCTGSGGHTATVCLPQGLTTSQCALGQEDTLQLYVYLRVSPLVSVHWVRRTHCNCMFTPGSHHQSVCTGSGGHTATVCLPQGLTTSQCALGQEDTLQLYVYPRVSPLVSVHWVRRTHCNCMFTSGSHHQSVCTGSGGHTATVCLPQGLTTSQCALGQEDTLQLYVYLRVSHQSVCTGSGGHTATVCLPQGLTTSQCALGQEDTLQLYVYPRVSPLVSVHWVRGTHCNCMFTPGSHHQSVCTGSGGHIATVCLPQGLTTSQCALGQEDILQLYVYPRVSPLVSVHWVRRTHCNCMFTPGSHHQSVCTGSGGHTATACLPQGLTTSQCALGQGDTLQLHVYPRVSPLVSVHWVRRTHCNCMFTPGSHHQSVCTGSGGHTATVRLPQGLTTSQCALGQEDTQQLYVYPRVSPLVSVHWVRRTHSNCTFTPGSHHQSVCTGSGGHIATVCLPQGLTTSQCALGQEDTLQLYVYLRVSPLVSVHWVRRTYCNCMFTPGSHHQSVCTGSGGHTATVCLPQGLTTSQCALGQEDTLQLYVYPRVSPLVSVHWVRRTYCNCMFTPGSHHQSVCTGSGGHTATVCLPQGLTTSQCALGQEDTLQLYVYPRVSPLVSVHWVRRTHCNCTFTPGSHHQSVCTGSGGHTATVCVNSALMIWQLFCYVNI